MIPLAGEGAMAGAIRQAEFGDLPGILALYSQLNPDDAPLEAAAAAALWDEIRGNHNLVYLVVDGPFGVVGTCNLSIIPNLTRSGRPFGVIENVVVADGFRRLKLGTRLMAEAVSIARAHNCYKVLLQSSKKRSEAHKFYEVAGFDPDSKHGYEIRL
ncbi:MAG TPA: GNAT family N-acetyltransferase [Fibrobacteria bacterium]|nr:GNAT family N-acetyltransferase [Fibrobacteria bacterium]